MTDASPPPSLEATAAPAPTRPAMRERLRRGAPLLLLAAGALVWQSLGAKLPRDHEVSLRFGEASRSIERVEIAWASASGDSEPAVSTRWVFAAGTAPRSLATRVRLPAGEWNVEIAIDRESPLGPLRLERRVALGAGTLVLPLEPALAAP